MVIAKAIQVLFKVICQLRKAAGFKQGKFAKEAGLHQSTYSEMEKSAINCHMANFIVICAMLDQPPWVVMYLAWGKDWHKIAKAIRANGGTKQW